jgi:hypothetical protein
LVGLTTSGTGAGAADPLFIGIMGEFLCVEGPWDDSPRVEVRPAATRRAIHIMPTWV